MRLEERYNDPEEAFRTAFEGLAAGLWTGMPGIIQLFDGKVLEVQPAILGQFTDQNGVVTSVKMPLLVDVVPVWQGGGGLTATFPIKQNDECFVMFANRCIDSWWQSGGIQAQAELRMHDLSDGFAITGLRSLPRTLSNISTTSAQLRTDDGTQYAEVGATFVRLVGTNINIEASSVVTIGANGTGLRITPSGIESFTDGTTGSHTTPTPPRVTR